jgi:ribosomal 50S subunit-recycling heat shock protein
MRIDKYLKVSRILKRRTISKELADQDRVLINGKIAKPSSEVKAGDEVELFFGHRRLKVKVLTIEFSVRKADAVSMYEVMEESIIPHKPIT